MKKRFLCLLLCVVLALPVALTGCSTKATTDETATSETGNTNTSAKAMTITLYSITDESTTDEAIAQVQDAVNLITESEFNTHVLLKFYTEDEYDAAIAEKTQAIEEQIVAEEEAAAAKKEAEKAAKEAAKAAAAAGKKETTKEETTSAVTETDETIVDQYGIEKVLYPEENGTQLDILLIRNIEQFEKYNKDAFISSLDEELSIGAKIIKQYIHPTFLKAASSGGKITAIPNNHVVGEYQYLLTNKELMDKYYYDPDKIKDITDIKDYLIDVVKNENDFITCLNMPEPCIKYFTDEPSLLGAYVANDIVAGTSVPPKNLLTVPQYINYYKMMRELNVNGKFETGSIMEDGKKYAAAVITGDYSTPELYKDDYYVSVYKYPTATDENVYSGMYAVSKYAADVSRCMDVIKLLTTNEEFINLFTYGVKNVNYTFDEDTGLVTYKNKDYIMNPYYTGNEFLMYPNENMSELTLKLAADNWKLAKAQNLDMIFDVYMGFKLMYEGEDKTEEKETDDTKVKEVKMKALEVGTGSKMMTVQEIMDGVVKVSKEYLAKLNEFKEYERAEKEQYLVKTATGEIEPRERDVMVKVTLEDFISELSKEVAKDPYIVAALDAKLENSPVSQYNAWFAAANPAPAA